MMDLFAMSQLEQTIVWLLAGYGVGALIYDLSKGR